MILERTQSSPPVWMLKHIMRRGPFRTFLKSVDYDRCNDGRWRVRVRVMRHGSSAPLEWYQPIPLIALLRLAQWSLLASWTKEEDSPCATIR